MIYLVAFLAISLFVYFRQRTSNRNIERFQNSRDKFDELIERLKKDDEMKTNDKKGSDKN